MLFHRSQVRLFQDAIRVKCAAIHIDVWLE